MDAGKLKGLLTNKIGPLPAVGWAGIAGGAYLAYAYYKHGKQVKATTTDNTGVQVLTPDLGTSTDTSGYGNATGSYTAGVTGPTSSASVPVVDPAAMDNNTWGIRAVNYLVALGVSAADASHAISSYMFGTGLVLNSTQSAALQEAIQHFGVPPEGVIDTPQVAPVVVDPTTPVVPVKADKSNFTGTGPDGSTYTNGVKTGQAPGFNDPTKDPASTQPPVPTDVNVHP